jgi:multidrug resistance efflux pump
MSRKRIAIYAIVSLIPLIAALWIAGVDPSYLLGYYVTSTSGYVTGDLAQASAPTGGSVTKILASVGEPVQTGQALAYVEVPPDAASKMPIVPPVRAPAPGTIVHLSVLVGQDVTPGQSVATIADLSKLWVVAAIDQDSFKHVEIGQKVDVYLPALGQDFDGEVTQLLPDIQQTTARVAGAPTGQSSPGTSVVPVRVDFTYGSALVYPGMNADVTIYIR